MQVFGPKRGNKLVGEFYTQYNLPWKTKWGLSLVMFTTHHLIRASKPIVRPTRHNLVVLWTVWTEVPCGHNMTAINQLPDCRLIIIHQMA